MTRAGFKKFVEKVNSIYYSMDWIPDGDVTDEVFNEENEMPENLKLQLIKLVGVRNEYD